MPVLQVPRRDEPRVRVPAGAVALAAGYSGVYPRPSPGGWQLIGHTDRVLWDLEADPPALLHPGVRVRFEPVRARTRLRAGAAGPAGMAGDGAAGAGSAGAGAVQTGVVRDGAARAEAVRDGAARAGVAPGRALHVLEVGPGTTVQDLGRSGWAHLGVPTSGAADRAALRLANRLVGNPEGAAALEVTLGGLAVRAAGDLLLAVTGATCPVTVAGRPSPSRALLAVPSGALVRLGPARSGVRAYLAVRGGLDLPPVLGSRSTDVLGGLGPPVPVAGDVIAVGTQVEGWPVVDLAPGRDPVEGPVGLRTGPGPRSGVLDAAARELLHRTTWRVGGHSDRIGLRLEGPPIRLAGAGRIPSEGMVRGAVQLPPGGQPVLFLADHPVTGGYPVVAVVRDADVDRAGQLRPGQEVRFAAPARVSGEGGS